MDGSEVRGKSGGSRGAKPHGGCTLKAEQVGTDACGADRVTAEAGRHGSVLPRKPCRPHSLETCLSSFQGYERWFIHKIKHKHILAKNYFSQIPVLASFVLDDDEADEIRREGDTESTPDLLESQRPCP